MRKFHYQTLIGGRFCSLAGFSHLVAIFGVISESSTSDWLKQISLAARPIRITTQIWPATCHQYGISTLVPSHLAGKTVAASLRNVGYFSG